ncbi:MAG: pyrroline-5-carboxylate reductase [Microthrixaceae bacterium]|nr:pyrroline-5-carboxylate reductase [Microthrixaceae bacterium]
MTCVSSELSAERRDHLQEEYPGVEVADTPGPCDGLVIATKPDVALDALAGAVAHGARRVLSIAAGVATASLEAASGDGVAVVRAMPNTPALVGAGATAICAGATAGADDLDWAEGLLSAVGMVERVPESLMDAVTGLSGSGPAYVFMVAEALVDAGVLNGLPRDVAVRLTNQTLLGASKLLEPADRSAEQLRAMVTSPGGTTAVGLTVLEDHGVRSAFIAAVTEAARRAAELGG